MLFSDVKVGQIFKYCNNLWMKFHDTTSINLTVDAEGKAIGWPVEFDLNTVVKIITKCKNCSHYRPNITKPAENVYYCEATLKYKNIPLFASYSEERLYVTQDPETFFCGKFENKIKTMKED